MTIPERELYFSIAIHVVAVPASTHTGKIPLGLLEGGLTENITEPLLQFPGQTVAIPTNHKSRGRYSSKGARPWLAGSMHSIGIIGAPAKTGPSAEKQS